jgi:hypothetical protein
MTSIKPIEMSVGKFGSSLLCQWFLQISLPLIYSYALYPLRDTFKSLFYLIYLLRTQKVLERQLGRISGAATGGDFGRGQDWYHMQYRYWTALKSKWENFTFSIPSRGFHRYPYWSAHIQYSPERQFKATTPPNMHAVNFSSGKTTG